MPVDSILRAALSSLSAFVCFYATGRAILGKTRLVVPASFAHIVASAIATTIVAIVLTAVERFTLGALLAGNGLVALAATLIRRRLGIGAGVDLAPPAEDRTTDRIGPLVLLAALTLYWPAYPTFIGASDSTAYIASGVSLAHHGTLGRDDELGPKLPLELRSMLFDSMSQVFESTGPPFRRVPGAMMIESLDSGRAWPSFFPVPSVWAAIFVAAGAPGGATWEEGAPGYSPVFMALALWAFWLLARAWLEPGFALTAAILLGISSPMYLVARMPLSEPIAAFFCLSGAAVLARSRMNPGRMDAMLAGAAFGAAVLTRIEIGLIVLAALALEPFFRARPETAARGAQTNECLPLSGSPAPSSAAMTVFAVAFVAVAAVTIIPATMIPGTWTLPLTDHLRNAWIRLVILYQGRPATLTIAAALAAIFGVMAVASRYAGWSAVVRAAFLFAVIAGQATAARFLYDRTPMWLSFSIGWTGLALAAIGCIAAWRSRGRLAGGSFVIALATIVILILFYNPHVYPSVPWGARRYVPLLLPLLMLLGVYAASRAAQRSRILAFACVALLAIPVARAVAPVWGRELCEGGWAALAELDAAIPRDGTILIDRELSPLMIGPALWLVHDRNNITVPPTGEPAARRILPDLVAFLAGKGPVYFVTRGLGTQSRTPFVQMKVIARMKFDPPFLEETYDRRPEKIQRTMRPVAIYKVERSSDPKGGPVQ
ncbi:MAG TPA: glycosyltransferase family 39 protein [Candidatus Limnocylindrales bacterium]|nr:glycosyltransferase family 39 protein [Candidatus Limnocylindrales bacterium]